VSLTPCPACDGPLVLMVRCVGRYAYYRCTDCSLVTSLPMPSSEELQAFYDGFLFGAPDPREHELNQLGIQRNVRKILQDCRERGGLVVPFSVLDWGGGVGYYANAFAKAGCRCTLIDIDAKACQYARETFAGAFEVINADPARHPLAEQYDLVFCNQVIEHCPDLVGLVDAIRRAVRPGGIAIITTPNQQCKEWLFRPQWFSYYLRRVARSTWQLPMALAHFLRTPWVCCDPPRHLHAFNRKSLARLLDRSGLTVIASFGQFSDSQYYGLPIHDFDWKIRRLRSILRVGLNVVNLGGMRMLHLLSPGGAWGDNLIVFARPARQPG
jgi:2-polyprenyl-3-methyl-5-hydroxy-6-metoxy-1,4-benzoquinol methylase